MSEGMNEGMSREMSGESKVRWTVPVVGDTVKRSPVVAPTSNRFAVGVVDDKSQVRAEYRTMPCPLLANEADDTEASSCALSVSHI